MRILEICLFSAGIDGVFSRVKEESLRLAKRNEVLIISSNLTKGSKEIADSEENLGKVKIKRFPAKIIGGESYMNFSNENEMIETAKEFNPDIIMAHCYRHKSVDLALSIAKLTGKKCFLVTHAPFATDENRSLMAKLYVRFYDRFIGPKKLKQFDKIIAITKWEMPYLKKLGINEDKVEYIPNGIPQEFFDIKKINSRDENKILFLGRVSPIKDLEVLIKALNISKNIRLEIVGPAEEGYLNKLKKLINEFDLTKRISFCAPIFDLNEKIRKIDSAKIFILPSKREAMPQSLIEAMARGKIVIASDNLGTRDLIVDGENGYLFAVGNEGDLANKINLIPEDKIGKNAKKSVEQFSWNKVMKKIEELIEQKDLNLGCIQETE
jgi:glycosyltransferase involved in cell wall biosynthesis